MSWLLVAEVKTRTPFDPDYRKDWMHQFALASEFGDMVSIHVDPRWNGSYDLISIARRLTDKPILAKGFCTSMTQHNEAIAAGAHQVLWIGAVPPPEARHQAWCEITSSPEKGWGFWLDEIARIGCPIVSNSRQPETGREFFGEMDLWRAIPSECFKVQASNIKTIADVREDADAILVGTHLESFLDTLKGG